MSLKTVPSGMWNAQYIMLHGGALHILKGRHYAKFRLVNVLKIQRENSSWSLRACKVLLLISHLTKPIKENLIIFCSPGTLMHDVARN